LHDVVEVFSEDFHVTGQSFTTAEVAVGLPDDLAVAIQVEDLTHANTNPAQIVQDSHVLGYRYRRAAQVNSEPAAARRRRALDNGRAKSVTVQPISQTLPRCTGSGDKNIVSAVRSR
jgi:hypothetical protein